MILIVREVGVRVPYFTSGLVRTVRFPSLSSISLDLEGLCLQMRVRWKAGELRDAWEGY